jgi:hypothetical protein
MPGKISFVKKLTIDTFSSDGLEIIVDGVVTPHINGHCEILDDTSTHTLTFNKSTDDVWIENISVKHLMVNNVLTFTTPIYRWLIDNIDNK